MLNKKEGINQRDLAEKLELETPTLVRILDAMEKQGLLQRRVAGSDRRAKEIFLTESGRDLGREVDDLARQVRAQICSGICDEDLLTTLRVVRTMQANMQSFREQHDTQVVEDS